MAWLGETWRQLSFFLRRGQLQRDLEEEMREHVRMKAEAQEEEGLPPEEARYAARREFGNALLLRERSRDAWGLAWLETLLQDLRYGLRQLRRNPGFTVVAVLTLALGIGANAAMFSIVNSVLLRPLPFRDPGRLVTIEGIPAVKFNGPHTVAAGWEDWVSETRTLKGLSVYQTGGVNVSGGVQPEYLPAAAISENFFRLLGVKPVLGRSFLPSDETPGQDVAIISYDLWEGRFGGERNVIGKSIDLAGRPFTIIGVMLPGFEFPAATQIWVPAQHATAVSLFGEQGIVNRQIARLEAGVTPEQARNELLVFLRHLNLWRPPSRNPELKVTPLQLELVRDLRPSLLVLMGAVGLVLLIACGNVANLLMARNAGRAHEITIRAAVGASRARLLRQLLTESVLLALLGGVAGLAVGEVGIRFARELVPVDQVGASGIWLDGRVLAFTFAVAMLTGVISGFLPALGGSRVALSEELKQSPATGSTRGSGLRAALGSIEVSLALILLIGAGLLIKSLGTLSEVNPGFRSNHLLSARLFLTAPQYGFAERRREFYEQVLDSARKLAGVREAAFVNSFPMGEGVSVFFSVGIEGSPTPKSRNSGKFAMYFSVSPDCFRTMGISLLEGREFDERDREGSTPVVIISQAAAKQFFENQNPIGKRITIFDPPKWMTIVGEVGDVRLSLGEKPWPAMYVPLLQQAPATAFLVLHTAGHVTRTDVVRAVGAVDRAEPVASMHTVEEILSRSTAEPRFRAEILGIFAGLALLIAAIGIYGVTAFSVSQRTHEFGIRMALGAEKRDVLKMVIGQGFRLALIGVAIGIAGALALTRFLSSMLYGVKPTDPLTFIAVSLILIAVALLACYIPARRAAKVDPMAALRYD